MARKLVAKNAKRTNKPNPRGNNLVDFSDHYKGPKEVSAIPKPRKAIRIIPRNVRQEDLVEQLDDENKHIVFAIGSAGTGKSMLCTLHALEGLASGQYKKILICRPNVGLDGHSLGFLPGTLNMKLACWTAVIVDIIKEYYDVHQVNKMIDDEIIEFISLEHIRGKTIKNAVLILDESQNMSRDAFKTVLTRIGENARILVTGDLNQVDRKFKENGLQDFITRLKNTKSDMISIVEFGKQHVERHPVVSEVLDIYGDEE